MATRNVLNSDAVDAFTAALSDLAEHELVGDWVRGTARRWFLRGHNRYFQIVRGVDRTTLMLVGPADGMLEARPLEEPEPDWRLEAIDNGREIIFLHFDGTLNRTIAAK